MTHHGDDNLYRLLSKVEMRQKDYRFNQSRGIREMDILHMLTIPFRYRQ